MCWYTPGEHVLDFGLINISVRSSQAGGCPYRHSGSSVKSGPWEVLLQFNGKCLSLWPETAMTLDQSPSCKSDWWFVTMPSPVTPEDSIDGAVFSVCTFINSIAEFILWLKRKAFGGSVLIMNKFLFMSPGYKGTSSLSLGRESALNRPVRNLRGSKHTGKAGLLSLFCRCYTQIPGTVLLWAIDIVLWIFRVGWEKHLIIMALKKSDKRGRGKNNLH